MPNVQSVVRAFHLLEALTAGDLGITELAERTELPKSTVARLVRTLERIGDVERADEDGRDRIGAQLVNPAGGASASTTSTRSAPTTTSRCGTGPASGSPCTPSRPGR